MERKSNWFIIMIITSTIMVGGVIFSTWGIYQNKDILAYLGLAMIGLASLTWWTWVMITISKLMFYTERTIHKTEQLKDEIVEVKLLLRNFKFDFLR